MNKALLKRIVSSPSAAGLVVGVFSFAVYLRTLAPTVGFIDSGELAAVACTLGIAHPTGYPMFTLLGWIFSKIPIAADEIVRLNLMAAFLGAMGVFVFFHFCRILLSLVFLSQPNRKQSDQVWMIASSASASLMLAFSETYWSQALAVEVYSLHALMLSLVLYSFLKGCGVHLQNNDVRKKGPTEESGWWLVFAFLLGLAFTNHMTTILLAPGMVVFYFMLFRFTKSSFARLLIISLPFIAGLTLYLYLPVRAAGFPLFNWGDPQTLERLLWHLSGKQYRVWIFSSPEVAGRQLRYFLSTLPGEVAYLGLLFAFIGIIALLVRHKKLALLTVLMFLACVAYSINYDIHDIDSYFLLAYIVVIVWACVGVFVLCRHVHETVSIARPVIVVAAMVFGLLPLVVHFDERDESRNFLVEDYTRNMFASLDRNALVLSFQWDYWVSASYYYQYVKNVRPDVAVVDKELLRRSWYLKELEGRLPWLVAGSREEIRAFEKELYKFEHDLPYDPMVIQSRFVEMVKSFMMKSMRERPVYVTSEIEAELTEGLQRVPQGLAYRLVGDKEFHPTNAVVFEHRAFQREGRLEGMVKQLYAGALIARGIYYRGGGNRAEARRSIEEALEYDARSTVARMWLERIDQ